MANKYRLKQWYPGLPIGWKVGQEVMEYMSFDDVYTYIPKEGVPIAQSLKGVCKHQVESSPEFWEKVEEKDYEILEVKQHNGRLSTVINYSDGYITALLNTLGVTVRSIRRKSDGEIFTVGDRIKDGVITRISLQYTNQFWLIHNGKSLNPRLKDAVKVKEPILITEDGKELFQGDYFWHVYDWEVCRGKLMDGNLLKGYRHFSTKELALEYVQMNKPMYNRKDILELVEELKAHTFAYWGYLLDVMLSKKKGEHG